MGTENLAAKVREKAEKVAASSRVELVHVEIDSLKNKRVVRIYIDKEGGITHDDCAAVSHEIESQLDKDDPTSGEYVLEVSSPGIERGLYSLKDFKRFAGKGARLKTHEAVKGQKNFRGEIVGVSGNMIEFDDVSNGRITIGFEAVKQANLLIDIEKELQDSRRNRRSR